MAVVLMAHSESRRRSPPLGRLPCPNGSGPGGGRFRAPIGGCTDRPINVRFGPSPRIDDRAQPEGPAGAGGSTCETSQQNARARTHRPDGWHGNKGVGMGGVERNVCDVEQFLATAHSRQHTYFLMDRSLSRGDHLTLPGSTNDAGRSDLQWQ